MSIPSSTMTPILDYNYVLNMINSNRQDEPFALLLELLNNACEAHATQILVIPHPDRQGLIVCDNGSGLSMSPEGIHNISPFLSFLSLGVSARARANRDRRGHGAKLALGGSRTTILTRCQGESAWRHLTIDEPLKNYRRDYSFLPEVSKEPWNLLVNSIPQSGRTGPSIVEALARSFFEEQFKTGTLIMSEYITDEAFHTNYCVERKLSPLVQFLEAYKPPTLVKGTSRKRSLEIKVLLPTCFGFWTLNDL